MRKGRVYRIVNKINGKSYIGQTTSSLKRRFQQHYNQAVKGSQTLLHKAMLNNIDNFDIEIIEDNIDEILLPQKEKYYIEKYNTCVFCENSNGYNMTYGGDKIPKSYKATEKEIYEVINLLKNTDIPQIEIIKKYKNVPVYDLNVGKFWYRSEFKYPLRQNDIKELSEKEFNIIIEMLETKLFSQHYIAEKLNFGNSIISNINNGLYKKYKYPERIKDFPIFPNKTVTHKTVITMDNRFKLLIDFINGYTRNQLMEKYNVKYSYIKSLTNVCMAETKYYINDLIFPIRDNKDYNLKLLNEKLELYYKYA